MGKRILAALTAFCFLSSYGIFTPGLLWANELLDSSQDLMVETAGLTLDQMLEGNRQEQEQLMQSALVQFHQALAIGSLAAQAPAANPQPASEPAPTPIVPTAAATPLPIITIITRNGYRYYQTSHDEIPDFGAEPTIRAARSGIFSDPGMWAGNRLPGAEDTVRIDQGLEVILNASATVKTLAIYGKVDVRDGVTLTAGTVFVAPEGALYVGTPADPRDNVRFVLGGLGHQLGDPGYYGDGLVALGRLSVYGIPMSDTFIRLAQEPRAGQTTLVLSTAPVGWRAGDTVFLPDTRQLTTVERWPENATRQGEYVTLAAVNGNVLTLTAPLQYNHLGGGRDAAGMPEILPHVANLTRRVVFTSRDPSGSSRAHLLATHRADFDSQYAELQDMGRLHREDGLRWEDSQELRQALHPHHLDGPDAALRPDGFQYTIVGNSIHNTVPHRENQGGFMLHGSHYGRVAGNVIARQNNMGFIAGWSGSESYNVIDGNFIGDTRYVASFAPLGDESGAGHHAHEWGALLVRAPNNTITNNVVAGNEVAGLYATMKYLDEGLIPAFRGADPSVPGQGLLRNFNAMPFSLRGTEVYSSYGGLSLWWTGATGQVSLAPVEVSGFRGWHNTNYNIYGYNNGPARIVNPWIRGDIQHLIDFGANAEGGFGIYQDDAYFGRFHITGADIQGTSAAIALIGNPDGWYSTINSAVYTQLVEYSSIKNNLVGVYAANHATNWASAITATPQRTIIRGVDFGPEGGLVPQVNISAKFMESGGTQNAVQKHEVLVYDYNREAGNNFRVHFEESLEGRIVPQRTFVEGHSDMSLVGSPEANRTNEENLIRYGLANGGDIVLLRNARRPPPRIQGVVTDLGHVWDTELGVAFPTPATTRLTFTATNPPAGLDLRALQALLYVISDNGTAIHTAVPMNYGGSGQWTLDVPNVRPEPATATSSNGYLAWVRLIDPSKGVVEGQHASTGMLSISAELVPPAEEPPVGIVPPPDPEPVTPPAPEQLTEPPAGGTQPPAEEHTPPSDDSTTLSDAATSEDGTTVTGAAADATAAQAVSTAAVADSASTNPAALDSTTADSSGIDSTLTDALVSTEPVEAVVTVEPSFDAAGPSAAPVAISDWSEEQRLIGLLSESLLLLPADPQPVG